VTLKREFNAVGWRPTVVGRKYAVSSGHYLATAAGQRILEAGGNAIDAGVTVSMALSVLYPDVVSFAGVAPTLIHLEAEQRVISLPGLGYWPAAVDLGRLAREGDGRVVPDGILRTVIPAAPATHIEALRRWGTISFEQAATPALELARDGYYLYPLLHHNIGYYGPRFVRYAENRSIFMPEGGIPDVGSVFRQPALARTIQRLIDAERGRRGDRDTGLAAVHDCFYRGEIARDIAEFYARENGFLTRDDLAGFEVHAEPSIAIDYKGYAVHACDVWCQGIVLLETLRILEGIDLAALGHNTPQYVHTLSAALNLAFSDREAYVGDPRFIDVPVAGMLDAAYAARQRARIPADRAFTGMPEPGRPEGSKPVQLVLPEAAGGKVPPPADTIYACAADAMGNAYSATLSDTTFDSPMIPGMGLCLSSRGSQSRLDPRHPSCVAPGKRPRLTPNPALALKDGRFYMAFGTPGGDMQTQAMLQVFLNINEFGFQPQQAVESPRFGTFNFPNSFSPHDYRPGRLCIENRIPAETTNALRRFGYDVEQWEAAVTIAGAVCAIRKDPATGLLQACADPRRESHAAAW